MSRRSDVTPARLGLSRRSRGGQQSRRRPRPPLGKRIAAWTSIGVTAVLVLAVLAAYVKYRSLWDSIKRIDVAGLIGNEPPKLNNAENILILGSDTRIGQNGIGGSSTSTPGGRSDTLMLLHISPGLKGATVMSIPRDSMVPILDCGPSDGTLGQQAAPGQLERINAALNNGGPACTWKTVAEQTGIHIDHFIQLDFTGFQKIINDLGGVNICLPAPVNDPRSGLDLSAGLHHVWGREALAFWREREAVGQGSDLQRIQRDQYLMASLAQGIQHSGLLNSPTKILQVITDAANAMTTDTGLGQSTMLQIAGSLRGLRPGLVQFVTAPNVPYPQDPNEVQFAEPQAAALFSAIAHDNKLPRAKKARPGRKGSASRRPSTAPVLDAAPSQVRVQVENGAGTNGLAGQVQADLTKRGFDVVGTGDAGSFTYTTSVIEYAASSDIPAVNTLKAELSNVKVEQNTSLTPGTITLIVGSTYTGLKSASANHSTTTPSISKISSGDGAISGNARICRDTGAFAGPNGL